jgi:hypothetical protein
VRFASWLILTAITWPLKPLQWVRGTVMCTLIGGLFDGRVLVLVHGLVPWWIRVVAFGSSASRTCDVISAVTECMVPWWIRVASQRAGFETQRERVIQAHTRQQFTRIIRYFDSSTTTGCHIVAETWHTSWIFICIRSSSVPHCDGTLHTPEGAPISGKWCTKEESIL